MPIPKFFCENCKREVSSKDKICPYCGRFFNDVRCPRCNFTGKAREFYNGCPSCGYLKNASNAAAGIGDLEYLSLKNFQISSGERKKKPTPPWVFLALTLGLASILSILVYLYTKL